MSSPKTRSKSATASVPGQASASTSTITSEFKHKFHKFDGVDKSIRVQTWLKLFEVHTNGQSDADRISLLMYNLSGVALEWYGDEIAGTNITKWETVNAKMKTRFGTSTATPLIDAQRRHLRSGETIETYYQEKIRLLRQTQLNEKEIIQQLTEGLPHTWKMTLIAARPTDSNSWVEVALQLESHQKSEYPRQKQLKPNKVYSGAFRHLGERDMRAPM